MGIIKFLILAATGLLCAGTMYVIFDKNAVMFTVGLIASLATYFSCKGMSHLMMSKIDVVCNSDWAMWVTTSFQPWLLTIIFWVIIPLYFSLK